MLNTPLLFSAATFFFFAFSERGAIDAAMPRYAADMLISLIFFRHVAAAADATFCHYMLPAPL